MEPVNAVGFPESLRQLIPLGTRDQDPPDAVESFAKIGRLTALFANVRFAFERVKLIFLGA
jgi:hypothetical protein